MCRVVMMLLALAVTSPPRAQTVLREGERPSAAGWMSIMRAQGTAGALAALATGPVTLGQTKALDLLIGAIDASVAGPDYYRAGPYPALEAPAIACANSGLSTAAMLCIRGRTNAEGAAPFLVNLSLDGFPRPVEGGVTLLASYRGHAGAPQGWSLNTLLTLEPGALGGIGYELDYNNWACEANTAGCGFTESVGLYLQGRSRFPVDYAILIQGVDTDTPNQWKEGITFTASIANTSIHSMSNATTDYLLAGRHARGIDMRQARFSDAALSLATGQVIKWEGATAGALQYITTAADASGGVMAFANARNVPLVLGAAGVTIGVPLTLTGVPRCHAGMAPGTVCNSSGTLRIN